MNLVESTIAARECQPVVLPYRRMPDDLDVQVEVGDETPHDGELLVVLLAEHRQVWSGRDEQLGDHGRHAVEVTWSRRALHCIGQPRHSHRGGEAAGVHRRRRRDEDDVDAGVAAGAEVLVQRSGVVLEVAPLAELERIDEDRHHDRVGELTCTVDQLEVPPVQGSHRRDERDRSPLDAGGLRPGAHGGRVVDRTGHAPDAIASVGSDRRAARRRGAAPLMARRRRTRRPRRSSRPTARHGYTRRRTCRRRRAGSG